MSGGFTMKFEGLKELDAALVDLGNRASAKRIGRKVLIAAAEPIADDMRARAPVYKGRLKRLIGVGTKLSRRQRKLHRQTVGKAGVEVFVGAAPVKQAHTTEFGTVEAAPHAWARPAWIAHRPVIVPRIAAGLKPEIDAAVARAATKALKARK